MFRRTVIALWILSAAGCANHVHRRDVDPAAPAAARAPEPAWMVIGAYSTRFKISQPDRNHNVAMAAARLNGAEVPAHGAWSFNREVGQRTVDGGWRVAPVLLLEGARPAVGGGICQVSSTVYNAALLADMRATQRHAHSRPVRYIPLGRDATVSWGAKDLVLTNPHPFPIRLQATVLYDRLSVRVLAPQALGYEVRLETADAEPASLRKELQILESPDRLAVGGVWVKLYRHRLRDGSVFESERVGRSSFYPFKVEDELR